MERRGRQRQRGFSTETSTSQPPIPDVAPISPERSKRHEAEASNRHRGLLRPESARSTLEVWTPSLRNAMALLAVVRLYSVYNTSPTHDCDEVFNYLEPLHFLTHGSGFQTWEWTPTYAIRSYAFELLLMPVVRLAAHLHPADKRAELHAVKAAMALLGTVADAWLYRQVVEHIHARTGRYLLVFLVFSAGLFQASAAILPSTWSMHLTTLALGFSMRPTSASYSRTFHIVLCFAFSILLGWPFAALLTAPFLIEELCMVGTDQPGRSQPQLFAQRVMRLLKAVISVGVVLIPLIIAVDSYLYGRIVFVPWNIFAYNVLSNSATLYGTESATYYLFNLLLNFNVAALMACVSLPMAVITRLYDPWAFNTATRSTTAPSSSFTLLCIRLAPVYLWMAILLAQPHKEERFLFPIFPLIAFNAAVALNLGRRWMEKLFFWLTKSHEKTWHSNIFALVTGSVLLFYAALGVSRMLAMKEYYMAPVKVMEALPQDASNQTLCYGGEWHRFPSSFHVPSGVRPEFIKSHWTGILPQHFPQTASLVESTRSVRSGFNDRNEEEASVYVDVSQCSYIVDLHFPHRTEDEPSQLPGFEATRCELLLDNVHSNQLTRSFFVPVSAWQSQNQFGQFCLLKATAE